MRGELNLMQGPRGLGRGYFLALILYDAGQDIAHGQTIRWAVAGGYCLRALAAQNSKAAGSIQSGGTWGAGTQSRAFRACGRGKTAIAAARTRAASARPFLWQGQHRSAEAALLSSRSGARLVVSPMRLHHLCRQCLHAQK